MNVRKTNTAKEATNLLVLLALGNTGLLMLNAIRRNMYTYDNWNNGGDWRVLQSVNHTALHLTKCTTLLTNNIIKAKYSAITSYPFQS